MAFWKCYFLFDVPGGQGYREDFLLQYESEVSLFGTLQQLAALRAKCLAQEVQFEALGYSDIAFRGDGFRSTVTKGYSKSGLPGEAANLAALFRIYQSSRYWANLFYRGLPDDWVKYNPDDGSYELLQVGYNKFVSYLSALMAAPSFFESRVKRDEAPEIAGVNLLTPVVDDPYHMIVNLDAALTDLDVNATLVLTNGRKSARGMNGRFRVIALTTGPRATIDLVQRKVLNVDAEDLLKVGAYIGATKMNKMGYYTYTAISSKKAGKSPFAPRGRRSNRR